MCVFLCPISCQFSKNSLFFFKKRVQKWGFSNFCVLSLNHEKYFLGLLKHHRIRGFNQCLWFFVVEKEEKGKKNDNLNFWFGVVLVQKWPFRDAYLFFKKALLKPIFFIVFFGCALFGPSWTPTNKRKF